MNQEPINNISPEPVAPEPVAPGPTTSEPVVTEQITVTETGPVFKTEEPKKGKGMLLGLVFCLILAIGGIGFGVWAMMDGNARADKLNKQISSLQTQNAELIAKVAELEEKTNHGVVDDDGEDEYYIIEEIGIKIKKSDEFPDLEVKKVAEDKFIIKENSELPDTAKAPSSVSWVKTQLETCDPEKLTLGYGASMEIGGACYIMGEILPYGSNDEYPMTDFLIYVTDKNNYSEI